MATNRQFDINGFMEVKRNPISKVGVFPYLGSQIGAPDPTKIYMVFRPAEALSDPETINSFKLLPWVDEHAMLGPKFMPAEQKGVHGVIGEDVYFEHPYLCANIKVFADSLSAKIEGDKIELSPGYLCEYVPQAGVYEGTRYEYVQCNIRGNHLALVHQGRTGPDVAVLDHFKITLDTGAFTMDEEQEKKDAPPAKKEDGESDLKKAPESKEKEPTEAGPESSMTMGDAMKAIDQIMPMLDKIMNFMKAGGSTDMHDPEAEKMAGAFDSKESIGNKEVQSMDTAQEIQALKDQVAALTATLAKPAQAMDTKAVFAEVAQRDGLVRQLASHGIVIAADSMTLLETAKAAAEKIGIACDDATALVAVQSYMHNRKPVSQELFKLAQDTAAVSQSGPVSKSLFNN